MVTIGRLLRVPIAKWNACSIRPGSGPRRGCVMKLTAAAVAALTLPPGKSEHFEWDSELPGFGVRLRGDGKRWVAAISRRTAATARISETQARSLSIRLAK